MPAIASVLARNAPAAPVKIGMITTLSGPGGYLGEDIRDGFMLGVEDGKLGGVPVQVLVEDDGLKPAQAKQIADRFLKSEGIHLFTGIIFSNVARCRRCPISWMPARFYVSPNAAPSNFAGKDCNKNYCVVSWQNDACTRSAGANANRLGYKKMYVLAPNYQAGKDALAGFKRTYKGEVVGRDLHKLDQTDFAPEMAQIRDAKPDAVFQFDPGGLGITFLQQYVQAGLMEKSRWCWPRRRWTRRRSPPSATRRSASMSHRTGTPISTIPRASKFVADFDAQVTTRTPTYYAETGLRHGAGDRRRAEGVGRRRDGNRQVPRRHAAGQLRVAARQIQIRSEPASGDDWYGLVVERGADGKLALVPRMSC